MFKQWLENDRKKGRSLPETGYQYRKVAIYRGVLASVSGFESMDYVSLGVKFAREHADHVAAVSDEEAVVLRAMVDAKDVFEAYNPGEYFYDGPPVIGKVIYNISY